jgi:hypothetical protein
MDIALLLELPTWLEDECEFDIMNLTRSVCRHSSLVLVIWTLKSSYHQWEFFLFMCIATALSTALLSFQAYLCGVKFWTLIPSRTLSLCNLCVYLYYHNVGTCLSYRFQIAVICKCLTTFEQSLVPWCTFLVFRCSLLVLFVKLCVMWFPVLCCVESRHLTSLSSTFL